MAKKKDKNDNLIPFKKGQSGNPKGRPKKLVTSILAELKEEGELVTRSIVEQTYQVLMSLTQEQLTRIASDKRQPMINRIVAKEMLGKKGFEIIEKMMDRANGKATQVADVAQTQKIEYSPNLMNLTDEELRKYLELANKSRPNQGGTSETQPN